MDAKAILKAMDRAAQSSVKVDDITLIIRRPTKYEMATLAAKDSLFYDLARDYTVGWKGVTEAHLIPSGGPTEVPFDRDIWSRWLQDEERFWQPVANAVMEAYTKHQEQKEDDEKN